MSEDLKTGELDTTADGELAVNDLEAMVVDKTMAERVKGGLGVTGAPGAPIPTPYPTTSSSSSGTSAP